MVFFYVLCNNIYWALLAISFSWLKLDIVGFGFVNETDTIETSLLVTNVGTELKITSECRVV